MKYEKKLTIIILSYNNAKWYKRNLDSIFNQDYENYNIVYVDDCSLDGTAVLVERSLQEKHEENRVTLIKNSVRKGTLANRFFASHFIEDDSIVVIVDGDDWLAHDQVFKKINDIYSNEDVWLTYGQFRRFPFGEKGQCKKISQDYNFRALTSWPVSHLRTYYAWLFKSIKKGDLMHHGTFFDVAEDVATMTPMLEMARGHIKFIPEVLYIYNQQTPLNDFKLKFEQQNAVTQYIRSLQPYKPLQNLK